MEEEGRDVADVLAGFDVEGRFIGGVAGEEGTGGVQVELYGRKLRVLVRDLRVEDSREGCMWE